VGVYEEQILEGSQSFVVCVNMKDSSLPLCIQLSAFRFLSAFSCPPWHSRSGALGVCECVWGEGVSRMCAHEGLLSYLYGICKRFFYAIRFPLWDSRRGALGGCGCGCGCGCVGYVRMKGSLHLYIIFVNIKGSSLPLSSLSGTCAVAL